MSIKLIVKRVIGDDKDDQEKKAIDAVKETL